MADRSNASPETRSDAVRQMQICQVRVSSAKIPPHMQRLCAIQLYCICVCKTLTECQCIHSGCSCMMVSGSCYQVKQSVQTKPTELRSALTGLKGYRQGRCRGNAAERRAGRDDDAARQPELLALECHRPAVRWKQMAPAGVNQINHADAPRVYLSMRPGETAFQTHQEKKTLRHELVVSTFRGRAWKLWRTAEQEPRKGHKAWL